jgi:hypothetical protein
VSKIGFGAADHQRVTLLAPPHAAGDAHVDIPDAAFGQVGGVLLVVGPPRVAAFDDHVAALHQLRQLVDGVPGRRPVRHHHPDRARRGQRVHQVGEALHVGQRRILVEADHLVPAGLEAGFHVSAHLAESDQAQLHGVLRSLSTAQPDSRTGISRWR